MTTSDAATRRAQGPQEATGRRQRTPWQIYGPVGGLVALALLVRFVWITHQSLWYDEVVSLTLAKQPFGSMLHDIARTESTPPLYYAVLWVWVRIFGTTALALRSLSALTGVATVVVVYLAARVRFSRGAALVAGAFAATNPMLIWYSQETRSYALVTLFVAGTLYFFLRSRAEGSEQPPVGWAITASLALASHYFAVFVVVPEAVLLLYAYRGRWRRLVPALTVPAVVGALLLPLAIHQRNSGHADFISGLSLGARIKQPINEYLLGTYSISLLHLLVIWLVIAVGAIASIQLRASKMERREVFVLLGIAAAAFLVPLAVAESSFFHRNLIVVLPPLFLAAGVVFVPRGGGRPSVVAGSVAALLLLAPTALIERHPSMQREDWRDMAALLGPQKPGTAVLAYPRFEYIPLVHYRASLRVVDSGIVQVRELILVGRPQLTTLKLPAGFRKVLDETLGTLRIVRFESATTRSVEVASLHLRPVLRLLVPGGASENNVGQDATLLVEPAT